MNEEIKNETTVENLAIENNVSTPNDSSAEKLETFDLNHTQGEQKSKNKSNEKMIVVVILVLLVLIGGLVGYRMYKHFTENPTGIVKKVINQTYEDFSSGLKKVEVEQGELDILKDPIRISGTLKYNDKSFAGLDKETIDYDLGLDYSKKYATGYVGLKMDAKTLGDVRVYFKNDKMYMTSDTMFDNVYDLGASKFNEMFDLSSFEEDFTPAYTAEDLDYVIRGFKDALIESLDAKNMTIQDENLDIDGEILKTKKITYKIDRESYNKLTSTLAGNVLKDDKLIEKLALIIGKSEDDIRTYFESVKGSSTNGRFDGEFSIYTTGVDYKLVKVEISDSVDGVSLTSHKDKFSLVWDVDGTEIEVKGAKNGDSVDVDVLVNEERFANFSVKQFDDEGIDVDYKVMNASMELDGNIKITLKKVGNKKFNGEVKASIGGEISGQKGDYALGVTYDVSSEKLPDVDVSKALTDFTEDDMDKMTMQMTYLQNSAFYQYFGGEPLIPDEQY